jgi:hypothetical protein
MADEPVQDPQIQPDDDGAGKRRSLVGLIAAVAVIIILVLVLLMLRGCGSGSKNGGGEDSSVKEIVPVAGLKIVPGQVSVWVAQGGDISTVLTIGGLRDAEITNMGGGRYVITVPTGTEDAVIKSLKGVAGVHDAGRVFSDGSGAPSSGSTPAAGY